MSKDTDHQPRSLKGDAGWQAAGAPERGRADHLHGHVPQQAVDVHGPRGLGGGRQVAHEQLRGLVHERGVRFQAARSQGRSQSVMVESLCLAGPMQIEGQRYDTDLVLITEVQALGVELAAGHTYVTQERACIKRAPIIICQMLRFPKCFENHTQKGMMSAQHIAHELIIVPCSIE